MAGLSIRVYHYDADTKEMHEVSAREWSVDSMPNLPLIDERWPLCQCYRCQGNGTPVRR
ncbi:hypothetical protein ABZT23_28020 [Streptomyces sp. NPDC005386]|uniref:hypothetical protein n=1 Tax=Streptomyces sp. NPDC005386 TaxID=3154562 RepID=UPI0033BAD84C